MRKTLLTLYVLFAFGVVAIGDALTGQVFIRTNGGQSVKLGLVGIRVFEREPLRQHVIQKLKDATPLIEYLRTASANLEKELARKESDAVKNAPELVRLRTGVSDVEAMHDYLSSSVFVLLGAPKPVAECKTDADGRFNLELPKGRYFVAATDGRILAQTVEFYQWVIGADVEGPTTVTLANNNLSEIGAPESLIKDPRNLVSLVLSTGALPTLESIAAFVEKDKATRKAEAEQAEVDKQKMATAEKARIEQASRDDIARRQTLELFKRNPKLAQQKVAERFPDLMRNGSKLNVEYVSRLRMYRAEKPEFFAEPDWPIRLAQECDNDIRAKAVPK